MKMIILCAGKGTRIGLDMPKCMLKFKKRTLLSYQIRTSGRFGLKPIVVTGFKGDRLKYIKSYHNKNYETTNMVESLICAKEEFDDDIVVSYGDIYYKRRVLEGLINQKGDFVVTVDKDWKKYWLLRYGTIGKDLESLKMRGKEIVEIGKPNPDILDIDGRFVGLVKFSKKGIENVLDVYERTDMTRAYTTDLLQYLIDDGFYVKPYIIENGWIEFDTREDYEKAKDGVFDCLNMS